MESRLATAVQAVAVVVGDELIFHTVQCELAVADAVAIAANQGAEVATLCTILHIVGNVVVSQTNIRHHTVPVGHHDAHDAATEVCEANLHSSLVLQHIQLRAVCLEVGGVQTRERQSVLLGRSLRLRVARDDAHASCKDETCKKNLFHFFVCFLIG